MRKVTWIAAAIAAMSIAGPASASVIRTVDLSFASGANFHGAVTFANDFSSYSAVSGVLNGYSHNSYSYNPAASDSINWVWNSLNYGSGSHTYSNFLMNGTSGNNYTHWITFGYSYNASGIKLFSGGYNWGDASNVDYTDRFTSGTVRSSTSVPEPTLLTLIGLGLVGLAISRRPLSLMLRK